MDVLRIYIYCFVTILRNVSFFSFSSLLSCILFKREETPKMARLTELPFMYFDFWKFLEIFKRSLNSGVTMSMKRINI
ncbi:unnamed protein product [Rhizophagus irregularis]|uniref:Uncharacterized protein n=1 Tax=Rhizophagus irregularis TaxID=588596 RepID=A0A916EEQ7_9GLOM|nr:unnamed protein product [Rhizophagus irregularis]GET51168.1 hypothetical protein RIR_jg19460.t1 [Rhizophagus irregularis DAOM 181602=DAOM 197198]CAB4484958.1 unnamed protein product [Rhizophagus irregularis]CAB5196060.1 unnamed protein product [Rhizophagus irregularis]CAB5372770.1 unnamed protein product [Rhizophagus irregularis]